MPIGTLAAWLPANTRSHGQAGGTGGTARRTWPFAISCLVGALLAGALTGGGAAAQELGLSASAERQIGAVMRDKAARTPTQRKISSRLLYGAKRRQADTLMQEVPALRSSIKTERDGTTLVDIEAEVTEALLRRIESVGGVVVNRSSRYRAIRAQIPLDRLEDVARMSEVASIRPADEAMTNKINTSEGDTAHRAALARGNFGVNGSGVKICALSDGVDSLGSMQSSGDLPAVQILPGQAGSGSEGTAMLEIIHDLAPGATLGFASAFGGAAQFAQNIVDLRNIMGCDVIVDDVFYFSEPAFQDGIIAQSVDQVVAGGAVYFSSAGNSGNLNDGQSGVWEGNYRDSGSDVASGSLHSFGGASSNQITQSANTAVTLNWSDRLGGSSNDYDLCVFDSTLTNALECSTDVQNGSQDPFEIIGPSFAGERLVIINFSDNAAPRFFHLSTHRGRLSIGTDGQTSGHAAAEGAFGVAAVDVATAGGGAFTGGVANPVETFSSDGPRRIFYKANGAPITPGKFLASGGTVRQKPDIAAADGVSTATPGFNPFFGTSAAAPHAAAIAGLMLSKKPNLSPADVRDVFNATALDIEATGVDRDSGVGIVDAQAALDHLTVKRVIARRTIDSGWTRVRLRRRFMNPVVIAGPPTFSNRQRGVVALRRVANRRFQARFKEWRYQDGVHPDEQASFLIVERGRTKEADGSIWEAGTFDLRGNRRWRDFTFRRAFPGVPKLFLTLQTSDGTQPVAVRARRVTTTGFRAALFEEERDLGTGHPLETVGYIAVYSPNPSGMIAGSVPYRLRQAQIGHRFAPLLNARVKLEEEKSKDSEVRHVKERISAMRLGSSLFAQQVTSGEGDTTALRQR